MLKDVLQDLKALQELHGFPRRFLRTCRSRVEQLRADANREITQVLSMCEAGDSAHFTNLLAQMSARAAESRRRRGVAKAG